MCEEMDEQIANSGDSFVSFESLPSGRYHVMGFFKKMDTKFNTGKIYL